MQGWEETSAENKIVRAYVETKERGVSSPVAQGLQQRDKTFVGHVYSLQAEDGGGVL